VVNPGRADERRLLKCNGLRLRKGDVFRCLTGGGGGFGDPRDRDPEAVRIDALDGHVSVAAAREVYSAG
jgi:N-methylhydantoinase B